jgi:hypothetical protein
MRTLLLLPCLLWAAYAGAESVNLPDIPDSLGRAGMMAAVVKDADGSEVIIAAGGCNYRDKKPWEGGVKSFYKDIYKLRKKSGLWAWSRIGELPMPLASGAFCATPKLDGLIIAGGCAPDGHRAEVILINPDGKVTPFADNLPTPRAYAGFVATNGHLILIGGTAHADDTEAIGTLTSLDLDDPDKPWRTSLADPAFARIIPLCGAADRTLIWGGGCALTAKDKKPLRDYREDLSFQRFDAQGNRFHGLPGKLAGCAGPGVAVQTHLFFVGGDDGSQYDQPPQNHSGQGRRIIALDVETMETEEVGEWPHPVAVAPLLRFGDDLITISGETKPGVRTPAVTRWPIPSKYR